MRIYFIADTHFNDDNIRRYENRPYNNVSEMDIALIENWNKTVSDSDEVYILGDFGGSGKEKEILSKLNGIKYLVNVYRLKELITHRFYLKKSYERLLKAVNKKI